MTTITLQPGDDSIELVTENGQKWLYVHLLVDGVQQTVFVPPDDVGDWDSLSDSDKMALVRAQVAARAVLPPPAPTATRVDRSVFGRDIIV